MLPAPDNKVAGQSGRSHCEGRDCSARPPRLSMSSGPVWALLLLLVPAFGAAALAGLELWNEDYLRGADAYYYALQADSWQQSGQVRIPDNSPLHPLTGLFIKAGLSPEKAVTLRLGLSLAFFSAAFYLFWLSRSGAFGGGQGPPEPTLPEPAEGLLPQPTKRRPVRALKVPAPVFWLWPLLSPSVFFCALEFPKTFSFTIAFVLALATFGPYRRLRPAMPLLLLLACFLHKMALVYTAALLAGLLYWSLASRPASAMASRLASRPVFGRDLCPDPPLDSCPDLPPERAGFFRRMPVGARWAKVCALLFVALSGLLLLLLFLSRVGPQSFSGLNLTPGALALFLEPNLPLAIKIELAASGLLLIWLCCKNSFRSRGAFLALCLAGPAFLPAFGQEPFSLGQRFGLMLPMMTALAAIFLSTPPGSGLFAKAPGLSSPDLSSREPGLSGKAPGLFAKAPGPSGKGFSTAAPGLFAKAPGLPKKAGRVIAYALLLVLALAGSLGRPAYSYPLRLSPPYAEYENLVKLLARREIPMLIVKRDFHFYYKFRTGREAFSYEPEKHWPKDRIWRLAYGVRPTEFQAYLPPECGWQTSRMLLVPSSRWTLIREDCYAAFRAAVLRDYNPELHSLLWSSSLNPWERRPSFLYKKHLNDGKDEFSALP